MLLLGDCAHLVEVTGEHGGVGDVFGGFGELQQDYASADLEEAHHDCGDGGRGAFEAAEEDGGCDNGRAGEEDVVGWGDKCSIEDIEGFLIRS